MTINRFALRHVLVLQFMILSKGDAVANGFFKNCVKWVVLIPVPLL